MWNSFEPATYIIYLFYFTFSIQVLTLKSSVGKTTSSVIPVKNAGNITARVKIKIEGDSQQFYVKPSQLKLIPEEVGKEY